MEQNKNLEKEEEKKNDYTQISTKDVINFLKLFKIMGSKLRDTIYNKD